MEIIKTYYEDGKLNQSFEVIKNSVKKGYPYKNLSHDYFFYYYVSDNNGEITYSKLISYGYRINQNKIGYFDWFSFESAEIEFGNLVEKHFYI
jgi:hypothetical protein